MALYPLNLGLSTLRYLTLSADAREDTLRRLDLTYEGFRILALLSTLSYDTPPRRIS